MKTVSVSTLLLAIGLLLPAMGFAHPGHGITDGHSLKHYLTEPAHAIPIFSLVAVVLALAYLRFFKKMNVEKSKP